MVASVVATPVMERLPAGEAAGVVRGATERAAYLEGGGFVVALTARGVPLMPNGIAVERLAPGDGRVRVTWSNDAAWEPRLPPLAAGPGRANALRERGEAIRAALAA